MSMICRRRASDFFNSLSAFSQILSRLVTLGNIALFCASRRDDNQFWAQRCFSLGR